MKLNLKGNQDLNRRRLAAAGINVGTSVAEIKAMEFVTADPEMIDMKSRAIRLSYQPYKVLITGESGTGKDIIAQVLHGAKDYIDPVYGQTIDRRWNRFRPVNCAGWPEQLFESSVFGYVPGAFTGAKKEGDIGLIRSADNGTVFFDEIGELRKDQQAKLLRTMESNTVTPVGGQDEIKVNVRFVFATHRNLEQMVVDGDFREDLYWRIAETELRTKPLKERKGDVPLIADYICEKNSWRMPPEIPENVYERGNVRALRRFLLRFHLTEAAHSEAIREAARAANASAVTSTVMGGEQLASQWLDKISSLLGVKHDGMWPESIIEKIRDLYANQAEEKE